MSGKTKEITESKNLAHILNDVATILEIIAKKIKMLQEQGHKIEYSEKAIKEIILSSFAASGAGTSQADFINKVIQKLLEENS
jgi:hypothetical protein